MKKLLVILLALCLVAGFAGCEKKEPEKETFEIAVVTDVGQLNDGGFNQGTYEGAVAFAEKHNLTYKYYQPANGADATDDDRIAAMRQAVENGAKVIVTPGFLQASALEVMTAEAPDVKFVFVDGWNFGQKNLVAISYKEHEAGYFAGYAAVKDGYTKLGGTFGGAGTNAACNRFAYGYLQGANDAAKELGITVDMVISFLYGGSFSASQELQTQVSGWYAAGTEVVFACGGSMLQSVKAAAAETENGKIIGVDVDQASESDRVITSAFKGLSASVQLVLEKWFENKWDGELADVCLTLGAAEESTGLPTAEGSWRFNSFTVAEYEALLAKVIDGSVVVRNDCGASMVTGADWADINAACTNVNLTIEE